MLIVPVPCEIAEAGQQTAGGERAVVEVDGAVARRGAADERVLGHFGEAAVDVQRAGAGTGDG